MVKKLILICLVGLLGIAVFAGPAWGHATSSTTVWIAQMDTSPQTPASEQPRPKQQTETPNAEKTAPKQTKTSEQQSTPVQKRSDKPFNPYDMKALKQFDAGDHRAK